MLQSDMERWGFGNGTCVLCTDNSKDDLCHRLLKCPFFNTERLALDTNLRSKLPAYVWNDYSILDDDFKTYWLLGNDVFLNYGHDIGLSVDYIVKSFLSKIYIKFNN